MQRYNSLNIGAEKPLGMHRELKTEIYITSVVKSFALRDFLATKSAVKSYISG